MKTCQFNDIENVIVWIRVNCTQKPKIPIDLTPNWIQLGSKTVGKKLLQSKFGLIWQDSKSICKCENFDFLRQIYFIFSLVLSPETKRWISDVSAVPVKVYIYICIYNVYILKWREREVSVRETGAVIFKGFQGALNLAHMMPRDHCIFFIQDDY